MVFIYKKSNKIKKTINFLYLKKEKKTQLTHIHLLNTLLFLQQNL